MTRLRTEVPRIPNVSGMPNSYGEMLDPAKVQLIMNMLDEHNQALDIIGAPLGNTTDSVAAGVETITSGALSPNVPYSAISCTGTQAYTLANGTTAGQLKTIECTVAATTPVGTLTITTPAGSEPGTHVFNTVGQKLILQWNGTGWHHLAKTRAGHLAVVVGTTVLTGFDMNYSYDLSVTGTVSSTGTKAIPAGVVPGEEIHVNTPTAASTPNGTIAILPGTVTGTNAAAATGLSGINATTCEATFTWSDASNGWVAWKVTTAVYS